MASTTPLHAVQHIRKMRGGAQSHLMRASDSCYYIVKFQNNPQHLRVLANEYLATRIGLFLGLTMPQVGMIQVSDWLIANTPEMRMETAGMAIPCRGGLQLASQYVADPERDWVFDYLPQSIFPKVVNTEEFPRVLVLDKWTGNADGRQAVFSRASRYVGYKAHFVDQGYCFNAGNWDFPDLPLHGIFYRNYVYQHVTGWHSFEPALSRAEQMEYGDLWRCASQMPKQWYEGDRNGLSGLIDTLYNRRSSIRTLITKFRESYRNPFPNWTDTPSISVPAPSPPECQERRA
jgi:hypothetical protein